MHETYRSDVTRSKEIGDYYRALSANYKDYEEWNTTPVALRDWNKPMHWPTNPHPEVMVYLERYYNESGQQVKGILASDALTTT